MESTNGPALHCRTVFCCARRSEPAPIENFHQKPRERRTPDTPAQAHCGKHAANANCVSSMALGIRVDGLPRYTSATLWSFRQYLVSSVSCKSACVAWNPCADPDERDLIRPLYLRCVLLRGEPKLRTCWPRVLDQMHISPGGNRVTRPMTSHVTSHDEAFFLSVDQVEPKTNQF